MKMWLKYLTDLRIAVLLTGITGSIEIFLIGIGRGYAINQLESEYGEIVNFIFLLPLIFLLIPFFYNVYKMKWQNIGFILLIWLSPIALTFIAKTLYDSI